MQYLKNDGLRMIKPGHPGNAFDGKRFVNYEDVPLPGLGRVLKWKLSKNDQAKEKKADKWLPEVLHGKGIFSGSEDRIVWMGHASFLIVLNGKKILTDPVFGDVPLVKRLSALPFSVRDVKGIDYVLISHGHFDHCDKQSLRAVAAQNPGVKFLAGLGMGALLKNLCGNVSTEDAGWYQQFRSEGIEIFFMPAFHWFKRGMSDDNTRLWGSFVIRSNGKTIFFMGDSGYNTHFKEIGTLFPEIDVCLMGIGAYKPSYIMKTSHTSPEQALQAFADLRGKTFIPMHYGTFDLTDEPFGEPLRWMNRLSSEGKINGNYRPLKIGEAYAFD